MNCIAFDRCIVTATPLASPPVKDLRMAHVAQNVTAAASNRGILLIIASPVYTISSVGHEMRERISSSPARESPMSEKIIRDPVHDVIAFRGEPATPMHCCLTS